jgi:tRNA pseudouridine38-40 synthase
LPVWKLILEYDGTRYHGWQEQRGSRTVAGELRTAAGKYFDSKVEISGSGRTDAGVHALGQVARLAGARRVSPAELTKALNSELPPDINVLRAEPAETTFDPRRSAVARYYLYQIATRRSAFSKRFVWWVRDPLDLEVMSKAANSLVGRHDFANFCERTPDERSTTLLVNGTTLMRAGELILFRIGASRFLWKMVRRIVGAMVEVGRGSLNPEDFTSLLSPSSRKASKAVFDVAAHTAPPSGLFLECVAYGEQDAPPGLKPVLWTRERESDR